jgi:hypothetical protein
MAQSSEFSHPESPVRHSYPLASTEDGFWAALALIRKTTPYILMRLGVLVGFTAAAIVWFGIITAIASLFRGSGAEGIGGFAFIVGFGVPFGLFIWMRRYVLYMLKAGHIVVLTRLITHGSLAEGVNQVEYGKERVKSSFGEVNILFAMDQLITGVVRSFNHTLNWVADFLPFPGLDQLMAIVNRILENATTYIDETIFSYNLARGDENHWRSARDGLVYYAQNWKPILKTATYSLLLEYALTFVLFLLFLGPVIGIGYFMPGNASSWMFIFAFALALCVRDAVLHPLFLVMVALTYHKAVQGQAIDPAMDVQLSALSDKFREIAEKAREWIGEQRGSLSGTVSSPVQPPPPPAS